MPPTDASDSQHVRAALRDSGTIDITTHGRRSGTQRRIEIVFFNIGGRVYISGMPGRRSWLANLGANRHLTFHLKRGLKVDLPATARIITEESERRSILTPITDRWRRSAQLERFVADAPLIEVTFDDPAVLVAERDAA